MSGHRKQRQVWVNDTLYGSLKEAAEAAGLSSPDLYRRLRYAGDGVVNGMRVRDRPPVKTKIPERKPAGTPLLRYGYKDGPLDRGLPEKWA
ncbi:MAG: hypothetical protein LBC88_04755 [Spirochaetaceae bacterium]|nr:hypothetical protein [Spirochaetaceae bacterium]